VQVYHALSGKLLTTLGHHCGLVYGLSWARDESCLVSASADFTAKVWHLASRPWRLSNSILEAAAAAACGDAASGSATDGAADGCAAAAQSSGGEEVLCRHTVLQHTCFVYAALLHPAGRVQSAAAAEATGRQQEGAAGAGAAAGDGRYSPRFGSSLIRASRAGLQACSGAASSDAEVLLVATGGYDGQVRLWDGLSGRPLGSVRAAEGLVNCLAFDYVGGRLYCGDSRGMLQVR
jgi:WD40 repeat protein